jgi:heat shock protein HslJ
MRRSVTRTILASAAILSLVLAIAACGGSASGGTITGTTWQWTGQTIGEPAEIPDPSLYTLTFAAKVDCNQAAGAFTTTAEGGITISPGPMTMAACPEGSLSDAYIAGLGGATSYELAGDQLVLTTATGTMTFE